MASRQPIRTDTFDAKGDAWFSAADLAELALPGLPGDKRSIARRAKDERWHSRADSQGELLVRPRGGQGGGHEFHASVLPPPAQLELARRGLIETQPGEEQRDEDRHGWRWFEQQTDKVRDAARFRLKVVGEIEVLVAAGATKTAAIAEIAAERTIGKATLWNWLRAVDGIDAANRLPALAPRRKGGGSEAEIDEGLWTIYKSDCLRLSEPTFTSCYDRVAKIAAEKGVSIPCERTFRRRFEREVPRDVLVLKRKGPEALRRAQPAQRRSVADMHALECVNIDGHKFDVFVRSPETGKPIRPIMVAIQDIYSRKVVAWRLSLTENAATVRLVFADLFREFGIPLACVLDNGRGFASKWITGGAKTRYRFKIRDEDPTGLLTGLGIDIHWALPYRGQSKPIERAFRDMCDRIAKHPAMEGAYTGNSPQAKPDNYGSRAIEWDAFVAHVENGVRDHNARRGRRGGVCIGRSFDRTFAESYAISPIKKADDAQLRMALLAADQKKVNATTGEIALFGNRYWSTEIGALAGQKVTVRFDPDNLHSEIHAYDLQGRYLGSAPVIADTGFFDAQGAQRSAKRTADARKAAKAAIEAQELLDADQVAAMQPDAPRPRTPEPSVVRIARHRGTAAAAAAAQKPSHEEQEEREARIFDAMRMRLVIDNE